MARDSCNHAAPGHLQEPPSLCPSSSPFCPVWKKRPGGKPAKRVEAVKGLPPRAPRIHPDPMDQQKPNLFQAQRPWERAAGRKRWMGREQITVRRLGTAVWNNFFLWLLSMCELPPHPGCQTGLLQAPSFIAFSSCYLNRTLFS